jgi:hypothetical protein
MLLSPCPPRVASRGVTSKSDEVAAPAGRTRKSGTRAVPGLRPGPLRVPARSWLKACVLRYRPSAYLSARDKPKSAARHRMNAARKACAVFERMWRAGRCRHVRQRTCHHRRFAPFGAPGPLPEAAREKRKARTHIAPRRGSCMSCRAVQHSPALPLGRARARILDGLPLRCLSTRRAR